MTWADANRTAFDKKGRIVCIDSSTENNIVYQLLKDAKKFGVLPDGLSAVQYSWIGATDNEDQNGSFLDKDANQSVVLEVNATEGDWHWLSGEISMQAAMKIGLAEMSLQMRTETLAPWIGVPRRADGLT